MKGKNYYINQCKIDVTVFKIRHTEKYWEKLEKHVEFQQNQR